MRAAGRGAVKDARRGRFAIVALSLQTENADESSRWVVPDSAFPERYRKVIEQTIAFEREHDPALARCSVQVTDATHHPVDSSAEAFREATKQALKEALDDLQERRLPGREQNRPAPGPNELIAEFLKAVAWKDRDRISDCLDRGADIDVVNQEGNTSLVSG